MTHQIELWRVIPDRFHRDQWAGTEDPQRCFDDAFGRRITAHHGDDFVEFKTDDCRCVAIARYARPSLDNPVQVVEHFLIRVDDQIGVLVRSSMPTIGMVDPCEFSPLTFADVVAWWQGHRGTVPDDLLKRCYPAGVSPVVDGPVEVNEWLHRGIKIGDQMDGLAWRLVSHLWSLKTKSCAWGDVADPVYGEQQYPVDGYAVPSLAKKANQFFKRNSVPWKVSYRSPSPRVDSNVRLEKKVWEKK